MGQRVNFNPKKHSKIKTALIVVICIFFGIIVLKGLSSAIHSIRQEQKTIVPSANLQFDIKEYTSLESLLENYNCNLISLSETSDKLIAMVKFSVGLYTNNNSNENYFLNLCKAVAEYIDYKNFELKDSTNNIDIEILCEKPYIIEFKINGDVNYYLNHDSDIFAKNRENAITNFTIQSSELQAAIDSNWDETKINWGTKESSCDGYNIYFDEGLKYKVVSRNIFNIIFTSNYSGNVAGGLNVNSSPEDVEKALGEPTFSNGHSLYGYVGENNYLFFDFLSKQISVYPIVKIGKSDEEALKSFISEMNDTNNVKTFASKLTGFWIDYDVYDFDSNYVDLRYTLKGVKLDISNSSFKNGIFIYKNYLGDIDITNLENVYLTNTDFVFEAEKQRVSQNISNRIIEGAILEEKRIEDGINFAVKYSSYDGKTYYGLKVYSRTQEFADSELDRNLEISSYKWYDESNIIYSINNDGIYCYNCENRIITKIINIDGEIIISSVQNGQIIYNNDEIIEINVN